MAGMDIGALRERIVWARCQSPIVILDSILARDLLERTGLEAKLFVYVQLNSTLGIPSDLDTLRVGRPVADLFRSEGLHPVKVTITAGTDELVDERGIHHVAKLILISQVQTLLHDGRLQIQKDLADAPVLRAELEDFRATVTDSGRWTFGARSGAHDDLVLALALAVWRANRRQMFVHPDVLRRSAHIRRPQHYLGMMPGRILSQF